MDLNERRNTCVSANVLVKRPPTMAAKVEPKPNQPIKNANKNILFLHSSYPIVSL